MPDASHRDEIRERIMSRVIENPRTGCWIWSGPTSGNEGRGAGYPRMSLSGQTVAVHLVMWSNEFGFIPGKKEIDHVCRNRLCVRPHPDHLELVSRKTKPAAVSRQSGHLHARTLGHDQTPVVPSQRHQNNSLRAAEERTVTHRNGHHARWHGSLALYTYFSK